MARALETLLATNPDALQPRSSYRGTSLIRNNPSLGPYSRLMLRALSWS